MHVRVVESRQDHAAFCIYNLRLRSGYPANLLVVPFGYNPLAQGRNRFASWMTRIHGVNCAIENDHVRMHRQSFLYVSHTR